MCKLGELLSDDKNATHLEKKMSEREAKIRRGAFKKFNSFSELNNWVNSELANMLYKIGMIDWEKNLAAIEGRPIPWYEECRQTGWTLD